METPALAVKAGSMVVTYSAGSRGDLDFMTPAPSQMAESLSEQSVIYSASAMDTSSSTAARYNNILVSIRTNTRELLVPRRASFSVRFQKNRGGRNSPLRHTRSVSSHSSHWGWGRPLE